MKIPASPTPALSSSSSLPPPLPPLPPLLSSFGSYPNVLGLTDEHRQQFHPVLHFPVTPTVVDYTGNGESISNTKISDSVVAVVAGSSNQLMRMATPDEWQLKASTSTPQQSLPPPPQDSNQQEQQDQHPMWTLGRYDEDRIGLYESALFDDVSNTVNGFAGKRTVHVGIDLGGPVGTPVHSFWNGIIHSVGYNPELGDYGHVVVIHYPKLPSNQQVHALYGHLDASVLKWNVGDQVRVGGVLAALGDVHENGGWLVPHVHFQLGMSAPLTHDMAGAVSPQDRHRALYEHPDPRYVLGELY